MRARSLKTIAAGAAIALTGGAAHALVLKQINNASDYWFTTTHLPDLDQVRTDLPNDGRLYCVPTAGINWMAYLTNHGAPLIGTGPANWEAQGNYDLASFLIASMGSATYMNTDPWNEGTDIFDSVHGLRTWLGDKWIVSYWIRNKTWSPTYHFIAERGLNGAHLIPGVGWYQPASDPCPSREGGHAFAIEGMAFNTGLGYMDIRDPATDDDEPASTASQQSPFTSERYQVLPEFRNPKCGEPGWQTRLMYRLNGLTRVHNDVTSVAYIDFVRSIFPQLVASAIGTQITYHALEIDGGLAPVRAYSTMNGQPIAAIAYGADLGFTLVVTGAPGATSLWMHTPGLDRWVQVVVDGEAPSDVVCGRHREAYVLTDDGTRLLCFDVDTLAHHADVTLPAQVQALAYDDISDEVIALSLPEHAVIRYAHGLQQAPSLQFPGALPFADDASIAWDPTDGAVWFIAKGNPQVYRITTAEGGSSVETISLPGLIAPDAIDTSDSGRLFVSDGGALMEFVPLGNGEYDYPPDPVFPGHQAGPLLTAARSRTNYEPDLVDEEWFDALPTGFAKSIPDCHADVTGDDEVNVDDLVAIITTWGTADPAADVNNDGTVGVDDLVQVIVAWGACG